MKPKTTYETYRYYIWPEHHKGWENVGSFHTLRQARRYLAKLGENRNLTKIYKVTRTEIK